MAASTSQKSARLVGALIRRAPQVVAREFKREFRRDGNEWLRLMSRRMTAPLFTGPGANPNKRIHTRTGALRRSLQTRTTGTKPETLRMVNISAGVRYARIQEFGGTITPKRAQFLTIPLPDNMTAAGVTRKSARQVISEGGFFQTSRRGNLLIFDKTATPAFVLKRRVTIPAGRLGFFRTWKRLERGRQRRHKDALRRIVAEVARG